MPYRLEWNHDNTLVSFSGIASFREIREVGDAHYGDPRLEVIRYIIVDFRQADCSRLSPQEIMIISAFDSATVAYKKDLKLALVVNDEKTRIVCEEYRQNMQSMQMSWLVAVFESMEAAREWCLQ